MSYSSQPVVHDFGIIHVCEIGVLVAFGLYSMHDKVRTTNQAVFKLQYYKIFFSENLKGSNKQGANGFKF